jgi:hypothetical protein
LYPVYALLFADAGLSAAGCLAVGAWSGRPVGLVPVAFAFGILRWAIVGADVRLQEGITDRARATVTSMAGFGAEVVAVLAFAGYAPGVGETRRAPFLIRHSAGQIIRSCG